MDQVGQPLSDFASSGSNRVPWLLVGTHLDEVVGGASSVDGDALLAEFVDRAEVVGFAPRRGRIFLVSSKTGEGIPALLAALVEMGSSALALEGRIARPGAVRLPDASELVALREPPAASSRSWCVAS